jgi:hypothetical protein
MPPRGAVGARNASVLLRGTQVTVNVHGASQAVDGCTVPGCARPHAARSYCQSHYVLIVVRGGHAVACRICGQAWIAPKASSTDGTHALCLIAEACPELAGDRCR